VLSYALNLHMNAAAAIDTTITTACRGQALSLSLLLLLPPCTTAIAAVIAATSMQHHLALASAALLKQH
jgi:hypothetical protein